MALNYGSIADGEMGIQSPGFLHGHPTWAKLACHSANGPGHLAARGASCGKPTSVDFFLKNGDMDIQVTMFFLLKKIVYQKMNIV